MAVWIINKNQHYAVYKKPTLVCKDTQIGKGGDESHFIQMEMTRSVKLKAKLLSDRNDFKTKAVMKDKGHYMMIKRVNIIKGYYSS